MRATLLKLMILTSLVLIDAGCRDPYEVKPVVNNNINKEVIHEANKINGWKLAHAMELWAKSDSNEQGSSDDAENLVCRSYGADNWTLSAKFVENNYEATGEVADDGFQKYVAKPHAEQLMAARMYGPFIVRTKSGALSGVSGDYLIKNYSDRTTAFPDEVWMMTKKIFEATYAINDD